MGLGLCVCGARASLICDNEKEMAFAKVECPNCGLSVSGITAEQAVEKWVDCVETEKHNKTLRALEFYKDAFEFCQKSKDVSRVEKNQIPHIEVAIQAIEKLLENQ